MHYWYIADAILSNCSYLIPCPILYAGFIRKLRQTTKHKKFQAKKIFFSFWVIFKRKTTLSTFTTFQESSSGKWAHILLVKCLPWYIVVQIFVIWVVFNVLSLSMGCSSEFGLMLWINHQELKILFPSNVYWH